MMIIQLEVCQPSPTLKNPGSVPLPQLYQELPLDAREQDIRILHLQPAHDGQCSERLRGTLHLTSFS